MCLDFLARTCIFQKSKTGCIIFLFPHFLFQRFKQELVMKKTMQKPLVFLGGPGVLCLLPSLAFAHVGFGETSGLLHGLTHPVTGLDHMLAMVAVGLWASQQGGRSLWAIPLSFVCAMIFGGILGVMGVGLPFVEPGIAASVLVLGLLVAFAVRMPLFACGLLVGVFAILHGHAHGTEMPETVAGLSYGIGFVLSTLMLHGLGILIGLYAKKIPVPHFLRYAGGAIACCGVFLMIV